MVLWKPLPTAKMSLAAFAEPNDTSLGAVRTTGPDMRPDQLCYRDGGVSDLSYHISCATQYDQVLYVQSMYSKLEMLVSSCLELTLSDAPFHSLEHDARKGPGMCRIGEE